MTRWLVWAQRVQLVQQCALLADASPSQPGSKPSSLTRPHLFPNFPPFCHSWVPRVLPLRLPVAAHPAVCSVSGSGLLQASLWAWGWPRCVANVSEGAGGQVPGSRCRLLQVRLWMVGVELHCSVP